MADDTRERFRERIRSLIASASEGRHAAPEIRREQTWRRSGLPWAWTRTRAACLEFLGMKGVVWEFAPGGSFTTHTVHSAEDGTYPRNWSALTNIVLA